MKPIYLDYAAATPVDDRVMKAMAPYWQTDFYNPSALYLAAKSVEKDIEHARASVASWLGARPSEIIFTAGGTEADNLAIHGVMRHYPEGNMVVSAIEHDAVLEAAQIYQFRIASVDGRGIVDVESIKQHIDDQTVLISVMYANNEVGTIQPLDVIADVLRAVREQRKTAGNELPLYFHVDASQAANYLDLHVTKHGVDLMTLNGGKIYGPKQTGALYVRAGIELDPILRGGGQERGLRSGTENVPGIIGFATALSIAQDMRKTEVARLQQLQHLLEELIVDKIPQAAITAQQANRLPNITHLTIPGIDNERVVMELDEKGIMCGVGSACSASSDEPSHVLRAMGMDVAEAQSSIRFSTGRLTDEAAIHHTVQILSDIIKL